MPLRANPDEREIAVDVLPTPPFCDAIEITIGINLPKASKWFFSMIFLLYFYIRIKRLVSQEQNSEEIKPVCINCYFHDK